MKIPKLETYKAENCYSAQIEGSGLNFRWRDTAWGIVPRHKDLFRRNHAPFWVRWFPRISIAANYHTGNKGVWCWLKISVFGFVIIDKRSKEGHHPGY